MKIGDKVFHKTFSHLGEGEVFDTTCAPMVGVEWATSKGYFGTFELVTAKALSSGIPIGHTVVGVGSGGGGGGTGSQGGYIYSVGHTYTQSPKYKVGERVRCHLPNGDKQCVIHSMQGGAYVVDIVYSDGSISNNRIIVSESSLSPVTPKYAIGDVVEVCELFFVYKAVVKSCTIHSDNRIEYEVLSCKDSRLRTVNESDIVSSHSNNALDCETIHAKAYAKLNESLATTKDCTCKINDLMNYGCKCGYLKGKV